MDKFEKYLILAMFVYSGVEKIQNPQKDATRLGKHLGPAMARPELIQLVGVFEIVASIYAARGHKLASQSLALFTILVTMVFYMKPLKAYPFLSNLSTLGGLLMMAKNA